MATPKITLKNPLPRPAAPPVAGNRGTASSSRYLQRSGQGSSSYAQGQTASSRYGQQGGATPPTTGTNSATLPFRQRLQVKKMMAARQSNLYQNHRLQQQRLDRQTVEAAGAAYGTNTERLGLAFQAQREADLLDQSQSKPPSTPVDETAVETTATTPDNQKPN